MANETGNNANASGNDFVSMVSAMEEESKKGGDFFKMLPTDQKTITVLSDPEKTVSNFDQKQAEADKLAGKEPKPPRTVFRINVQDMATGGKQVWEFGNRTIMSQLVAIIRQYGLKTLVGAQLMLKTSGTDNKNRAWFIMLMSAPGMTAQAYQPAPPAQPAADPAGVAWVESQKAGMKAGATN